MAIPHHHAQSNLYREMAIEVGAVPGNGAAAGLTGGGGADLSPKAVSTSGIPFKKGCSNSCLHEALSRGFLRRQAWQSKTSGQMSCW